MLTTDQHEALKRLNHSHAILVDKSYWSNTKGKFVGSFKYYVHKANNRYWKVDGRSIKALIRKGYAEAMYFDPFAKIPVYSAHSRVEITESGREALDQKPKPKVVKQKPKPPAKFKELSNQMVASGDTNGCVVIAAAAVMGVDYSDIVKDFDSVGRRRGGGTQICELKKVLNSYGLNMKELSVRPKTVARCEQELDSSKTYLIMTSGHMLAMVGGVVCNFSRGGRRRPILLWQVETC